MFLQEYLRAGTGNDLESLVNDYAIKVFHHPTQPLVGFKYCQLDSPKNHPIVKECRGIVLEKDTWNLVGKPFTRFFNLGENLEETEKFNWSNFSCLSKEDGSLGLLYYYNNEWHYNTSKTFGLMEFFGTGKSWHDVFWKVSGIDRSLLVPGYTYIFELCTPYNLVVRSYPKSTVFLLSVFDGETELSSNFVSEIASVLNVPRPEEFWFKSREEIFEFLCSKENTDPTYEGLVLRDSNNLRLKCKSKTYCALHRLKNNGNFFNPSNLVPLVLAGECDEVSAILPEVKEALDQVRNQLDLEFTNLLEVWNDLWQVEGKKEFAQKVFARTQFYSLLFNMRQNHGDQQTPALLLAEWRQSEKQILKILFGKKRFKVRKCLV